MKNKKNKESLIEKIKKIFKKDKVEPVQCLYGPPPIDNIPTEKEDEKE